MKVKGIISYMPHVNSATFSPPVFKSQQFSIIAYIFFHSPLSLHNNLTLVEAYRIIIWTQQGFIKQG